MTNRLVQHITVEESTSTQWVKTVPYIPTINIYPLQEPNLGDMLEYIEARNKVLDEEGKEIPPDPTATTPEQFMSLIKFNGVPILPPVVRLYDLEALLRW